MLNNPSAEINNPSGRITNFGLVFGARYGEIYCTIYGTKKSAETDMIRPEGLLNSSGRITAQP
jgi:hypothetical protein